MYTAEEVANWILTKQKAKEKLDSEIDPMTQMKLHKLLYYAQGVYLAITNHKLFSDDLFAWAYGPVVEAIYDKNKGRRVIDGTPLPNQIKDYEKISNNDNVAREVLEAVFDRYGDYSDSQLINMTHNEAPWRETHRGDVISVTLIRNFFRENIVDAQ